MGSIREYAKQHGTELSFVEAVKLLDAMVVTTAGAAKLALPMDIVVRPPGRKKTASITKGTIQKKARSASSSSTEGLTTSKQRVLLANLHATAYYEDC
jgi:hypothetical protein